MDAAGDLKYTTEVRRVLSEEFASPSEGFVGFIIKQAYKGRATTPVREMFSTLTHQALTQFINERIDNRLKSALEQEREPKVTAAAEAEQVPEPDGGQPALAPLEVEALQIVKALIRDMADVRRVILRRYTKHSSILLDDNRFKIVCRLWFGSKGIRLGLSDDYTSIPLETLDGLYDQAGGLRDRLARLVSRPEPIRDGGAREDGEDTSR